MSDLESSIADSWKQLQDLAREAAKRLVDDFPNSPTVITARPMAEQFCAIQAPTSMHELLMRQMALTSLTSQFDNTRASLEMDRMFRRSG